MSGSGADVTPADADWRSGLTSLQAQQLYMLEHSVLSDCTFTVGPQDGETKEFRLHRLLLSRASAVLEAMLLPPGEGPQMLEAQTGGVRVTDIQPDIFHIVVRHVYGYELDVADFETLECVAHVADKYQMSLLRAACETWMCQEQRLGPDTVWRALQLVDTLQGYTEQVRKACVQVLRTETSGCLQSFAFLEAPESAVALLLEQEELSMTQELVLIAFTVRWAQLEAKRRTEQGLNQPGPACPCSGVRATLLPHLLPLLRLLAITPAQFFLGPALADWLTEEEKNAILDKKVEQLPPNFSRMTQRRKLSSNLTFPLA